MKKDTPPELTEDIEIIGPGQILTDARNALSLSIEQVAESLNFRICQVKDIEADNFDKSVPETFTRGYLTNYAKLVNADIDEVLMSYEALGVAKKQGAEMQSFSKITEKEAHHSRLMWVSYVIIFILVALSIVYYIQDANQQKSTIKVITPSNVTTVDNRAKGEGSTSSATDSEGTSGEAAATTGENLATSIEQSSDRVSEQLEQTTENVSDGLANATNALTERLKQTTNELSSALREGNESQPMAAEPVMVKAIFTFAGDCWVNIQDGTGERIAYGIKKAGYVMELTGVPPFQITVGKPELVAITFDGDSHDMSQYSSNNIAKFTLPTNPES